jgi:hypothetical protein
MRIGLRRTAALVVLALAVAPATALAAGGIGGGGAARPLCTGGGGCTVVGDATNFTLGAPIGPIWPFEVISMRGTARYEVKDGHRSLVVSLRDLLPLAGQPLELLVGNVVQQEVVVSPTGTLDWSVDTARGDAVPGVAVFTQIIFTHPNFLVVGGGTFH